MQLLVHVHDGQLGLVEAGEKLVGHHQQAVFVAVELFFDILAGKAVEHLLGVLDAVDRLLAGEGDHRLEGRVGPLPERRGWRSSSGWPW